MRYLGQDEGIPMSGYFGEVAEGSDGMLYQWVEGVDGLGNSVGFWKKFGKRLLRRALPLAQRFAPFVPGVGPVAATAISRATPLLRQAGLVGYGGLGALYQAPDGSMYRMEGLSEDELQGDFADDELQGYAADEGIDGLDAGEELDGLYADEELSGFSDDEELRGVGDDEISGIDADDDLSEVADGDDLQGLEQAYVQDGMNGVEAYVPQQAPATRWFTQPAQSPSLWKPLW